MLGGSSDIARAVTRKLCAARAHTVVLAGRNQNLLDAAAQETHKYGVATDTVLFDARDVANARATVSEAFEKAGDRVDLVRLSCLFAEALGFKPAPKVECEPVESLIGRIPEGGLPRSRFSLGGLSDRLRKELQLDA